MDAIGGYFELETNDFGSVYHDNAIAVNSCRNALEYILLVNNYKKIYLPYYTCDVTLQPIKKLKLDFEFYYLDKNFLPQIEKIEDDAILLFVNYYGLMNYNISIVRNKYKNIIIDNAQAFYAEPLDGVPTIYSPRKFLGVPDGGFVYCDKKLKVALEIDKSGDRISHLISRIENGAEKGYNLFQKNDAQLDDLPLRKMSKLTDKLLRNIDFEAVRQKRNQNFEILHHGLKSKNELTPIIEKARINGPMVYPFLMKDNNVKREQLIENKIFVAKYWPNVIDWIKSENVLEKHLYDNLIPLPVDQRFKKEDMRRIITKINL